MLLFLLLNMSCITSIHALIAQDELIYEGIDISSWQRNINFSEVKNAGIEVVYIKASEGRTLVDPYLEVNYRNAKAHNLKIGFYHYLTATTVSAAETQARFFASVIEGKEVDCKLAMDYENFYGEGKEEINEIALAFIKKLKEITGKDVIVYSNLNNVRNTFDSEVAKAGKLWLAYYSNTNNLINAKSNWDTYIGIQYTSTGRVPGINGNVDKDRFSKEILMADLQASGGSGSSGGDEPNSQIINYIVKPGDTLSQIAMKYGTTVSEIARLNGIRNVNLIYPGQVLEIMTNSNNTQANPSEIIMYTIQRGDTLWGISRRYGVSIQNLINWNNIKKPNLIYTGNTLKIYVNGVNDNGIIKYIVQRGDNLSRLALRFGTTVKRLAQINGIQNQNLIYVGQILYIY